MAGVRAKRRRRRLVDVVAFLPLVVKLARRFARRLPAHVEIEDLISSGVIGLLDAAARYDPSVRDRFEVFAEFRIRGAMTDYMRSTDTLSRDMRRLAKQLREATRKLEGKLGRNPEPDELAQALGVTLDELYATREKLVGSTVIGIEDAGPDFLERVADQEAEDPFEIASHREEAAILIGCILKLPPKLQQVLSMYYVHGMTFREIGEVMDVTESRICQIHGEAIRRLRGACAQLEAA